MFVLAEMKHVIRTPPWKFNVKLTDAIAEELNKKLANKVSFHNLMKCGDDGMELQLKHVARNALSLVTSIDRSF